MIKSNDCILTFALDGENYFPVYCGTGFAFTVNTEIIETTTKGDGQYQDFDYNSLSYTLTIEGIGKLDTYNTFDVLLAQRTFMDVPFRLICQEGDLVKVIEGIVIVLSTDLKVTAGEHMNYSHDFRGRGPYEIRDTIEDCNTDISSAYILIGSNEPTTSDTTVAITSMVGTAASFDWSVDGGAISNSTSNEFLIGVLAPGSHSITITPICENGVSGIGVTKAFSV